MTDASQTGRSSTWPSSRPASGGTRAASRSARRWCTAARCWPWAATGACSWAARSGTGRPTASTRPGGCPPRSYRASVLYTTLSPCFMCAGTALLYEIPRIVIGENRSFQASEDCCARRASSSTVVDDAECMALMRRMIAERPRCGPRTSGRSVNTSSASTVPDADEARPSTRTTPSRRSRARAQVVLLRRRRAARLHGLHADDAGRRRARRGVRLRSCSWSSCSGRWCSARTSP